MASSYEIDPLALREEIRGAAGAVVVLDARPAAAYREGHIPGAAHLDLFDYFVDTSAEGIDRLNQELADILGKAGVGGGGERVVCYEDEMGMRAARLLWFIEYAGHPNVRLLRGGFRAWLAAGGASCQEPCVPAPRSFRVSPRPDILATAEYVNETLSPRGSETAGEVRSGVADTRAADTRAADTRVASTRVAGTSGGVALDVRSLGEHRGETTSSHGPCCPRAGRIPGSIWLEWTLLLTEDRGRMKPAAEIRRLLAERGVTPEQEVVTYCHRGARAAAAYVALKEAGFERVRNYIGSWHEWAEIPRLPIATG